MTNNYEWNFSLLYSSDTDPAIQSDIDTAKAAWGAFITKWKNNHSYLSDVQAMVEAIEEYNGIQEKYGMYAKPLQYFVMKSELNKESEEIKAALARIENEYISLVNDIQFFSLSISRIQDRVLQEKFLSEPRLLRFKHYFEMAFRQGKYALTDAEEKILNLTVRPAYGSWTEMVSKFVSKAEREVVIGGEKKKLPFGSLVSSIVSPDTEVRRAAGTALHDINKEYSDIATEELNAILEYKRNIDSVRGYERSDLERHISDDIDSEVVDALVKAVSSRNAIAHTFYKKKAARMGVKTLKYYDRVAQVGEYSLSLTYEDAMEQAQSFFSGLDNELGTLVSRFFEEGRVDPFPKKGKNTGGFCIAVDKSVPPYILMNYTNTINDVTTLVHELGHGVHNTLTAQSTPAILCDTPTSLAEVASTFFEGLVLQKVVDLLPTEKEKNVLQYETADQDIQTIFRQIALYRFEQELHALAKKEGYLSTDVINQLFLKHMKEYMGDVIEFDPGSEYWWVYWSHIRNFFYVYSYASGVLIAKALQNLVKKDAKKIEVVKNILRAGGSRAPKDLFSEVGIDITDESFWNLGLDEIEMAVNALP